MQATGSPQLFGGELLLVVTRTAIKYPHQGLLVEIGNLITQGLNIVDFVTVRQTEVRDRWARRRIIERGPYLRRDHSIDRKDREKVSIKRTRYGML